MSFRQNHESGNKAVTLLASCFVVLGGAASCTAIVVAADPAHLESAILPVAGTVLGIAIVLWVIRERPPESRARVTWRWLGRRRARKVAYRLKARLPRCERTPPPAGPPTANSIREITGRRSTWVPTVDAHTGSPSDEAASSH